MAEKKNVLVFPAGTEIAFEIHQALRYSKFVRLFGATAKLGQPVTLVGEIDFAIQGGTMTWYADGAQLTDEDGNWAIPMSLGPKQISRFVFDSETATIDSLSGDFDIGFNGTMILLF